MSSYDVQRRKLFPIIREAILKAYNEYGLGLDEDLASAETLHIFKDITAEGYRRESEVAAEIFAEIEKECDINGEFQYWRFLELKKKYTEGKDDKR